MTSIISDNIVSALGFSTAENYSAVRRGDTGLRRYEAALLGVSEAFVASMIDRKMLAEKFAELAPFCGSTATQYTPLEMAAIVSASDAIGRAQLDAASSRVLFVLSTTKGNVQLLGSQNPSKNSLDERVFLWHSAKVIAEFFGNTNTPIVVSNACISGASALLKARQALEVGQYDYAVVVGADMLSKFIVSGFQSFKALSPAPCRPFDAESAGLNLGEAAATIVLCDLRRAMCDKTAPLCDVRRAMCDVRRATCDVRQDSIVLSHIANHTSHVEPSHIAHHTSHVEPEHIEKDLKDRFRAKVRVAPEVEICSAEEIRRINFPDMSRKPVKFIDRRRV